jgi:hypothetical protein
MTLKKKFQKEVEETENWQGNLSTEASAKMDEWD